MTTPLKLGFVLALIASVVVAVLYLRPKPTPIPRAEQRSLDSLEMTKPGFVAKVDTLVRTDTVFRTVARREAIAATESRKLAEDLRTLALAKEAEARNAASARDSAAKWASTALTYKAEADTAHGEAVHWQNAYAAETTRTVAANLRATLTAARLSSSENLNLRLAADLARSSPPCRVLWMRCPSRKAVAVMSVATGIGVALYGRTLIGAVRP